MQYNHGSLVILGLALLTSYRVKLKFPMSGLATTHTVLINHFCYKVKLSLVFMTSSYSKKKNCCKKQNNQTAAVKADHALHWPPGFSLPWGSLEWKESSQKYDFVTVHITVTTQRGTPWRSNEAEPTEKVQAVYLSVWFDRGGRVEMQSGYIKPVLCSLCHEVWQCSENAWIRVPPPPPPTPHSPCNVAVKFSLITTKKFEWK